MEITLKTLLYSEDKILESSVVKVINPEERYDGNLEFLESSSSLVAKEILQEAPELITQQLAHLLRGEKLLFILMECFCICSCSETVIHSLVNSPFKDHRKLHEGSRVQRVC